MPKYVNLAQDLPKMKIFENFSFTTSSLLIRFQQVLNQYQATIFSQIMSEAVIFGQNAQVW